MMPLLPSIRPRGAGERRSFVFDRKIPDEGANIFLANRVFCAIIARMIKRQAQAEITELLEEFPAVGVLGPRQIGKTTLAEAVAASIKPLPIYLDLET